METVPPTDEYVFSSPCDATGVVVVVDEDDVVEATPSMGSGSCAVVELVGCDCVDTVAGNDVLGSGSELEVVLDAVGTRSDSAAAID